MADWYSKVLGGGLEALILRNKIPESYLVLAQLHARTGHYPTDAAVFSRHDLETNLVTVYFTPSAELLALEYGATPCNKPEPTDDFILNVGDPRAWEVHFPRYLERRRSGR